MDDDTLNTNRSDSSMSSGDSLVFSQHITEKKQVTFSDFVSEIEPPIDFGFPDSPGVGIIANSHKNSADSILENVYMSLEGASKNAVDKRELLSLSAKLSDDRLLKQIRDSKGVQELLKPAKWGRKLLVFEKEKGNTISLSDFLLFWKSRESENESPPNSISQTSISKPTIKPNHIEPPRMPPPPTQTSGMPLKPPSVLPAKPTITAPPHTETLLQTQPIAHTMTPPKPRRISVTSNIPKQPVLPIVFTVNHSDMESFVQDVCAALQMEFNKDLIILNQKLNARILRVQDIEDGDTIEIAKPKGVQKTSPKVSSLSPKPVTKSRRKPEVPTAKSKPIVSTVETISVYNAEGTNPEVDVYEGQSWKERFHSKPLPSGLRSVVRNLFEKFSNVSLKWRERVIDPSIPSAEQLVAHLEQLKDEFGSVLTMEKMAMILNKLGIAYGFGRNHIKLLFDAIDTDLTGSISILHLGEVVEIWREFWVRNNPNLFSLSQKKNPTVVSYAKLDYMRTPPPARGTTLPPARPVTAETGSQRRKPISAEIPTMEQRPQSSHVSKRRPQTASSGSRSETRDMVLPPSGNQNSTSYTDLPAAPRTPVASTPKIALSSLKTEEQFLRVINASKIPDADLLQAYAAFLMGKISRHHKLSFLTGDKRLRQADPQLSSSKLARLEKARTALEQSLNVTNMENSKCTILCSLGEVATAKGQYEEAKKYFLLAQRRNGNNKDALVKYAILLHKLGEIEPATEYYMRALSIDEHLVEALLGYALVLADSNEDSQNSQASGYFERALLAGKTSKIAPEEQAQILAYIGKYQNEILQQHKQALSSYKRACKLDTKNVAHRYEYGRLLFAVASDVPNAVSCFEAVLSMDPIHVPALLALAQLLSNSNVAEEQDRANTLYSRAIEVDPSNFQLLLSYAEYCGKVCKSELNADLYFERAATAATSDFQKFTCSMRYADYNNYKADLTGLMTFRMRAADAYEAALSKESIKDVEILERVADTLILCKRYHNATIHLKRALELSPGNGKFTCMLGRAEAARGNIALANSLFRNAFEQDDKSVYVLVHYARFLIELAKILQSPKNLEMARDILHSTAASIDEAELEKINGKTEASYRKSPEALVLVSLGELLIELEHRAEGVVYLEKVVRIFPHAVEPRLLFARVLVSKIIKNNYSLYWKKNDGQFQMSNVSLEDLSKALDLYRSIGVASLTAEHALKEFILVLCVSKGITADSMKSEMLTKEALEIALVGLKQAQEMGRSESSVDTSKAIIHLAEWHYLVGYLYESLGNVDKSMEHLRSSVETYPNSPIVWYLLGRILENRIGDLERAHSSYRHALEIPCQTAEQIEDNKIICTLVIEDYQDIEKSYLGLQKDVPLDAILVMHQNIASFAGYSGSSR